MLRKTSRASDSGIEEDRDLDPDDAAELNEDLDDLRSEGARTRKSTGVRISKVTFPFCWWVSRNKSRLCDPFCSEAWLLLPVLFLGLDESWSGKSNLGFSTSRWYLRPAKLLLLTLLTQTAARLLMLCGDEFSPVGQLGLFLWIPVADQSQNGGQSSRWWASCSC